MTKWYRINLLMDLAAYWLCVGIACWICVLIMSQVRLLSEDSFLSFFNTLASGRHVTVMKSVRDDAVRCSGCKKLFRKSEWIARNVFMRVEEKIQTTGNGTCSYSRYRHTLGTPKKCACIVIVPKMRARVTVTYVPLALYRHICACYERDFFWLRVRNLRPPCW